MRNVFTLLCLIPLVAHAQLDRIRVNMTEQEFVKAVPEAKRDLEAESGWIEDSGSVASMNGWIHWRIFNDSIDAFYFASETVEGPSEQFPSVDSTAVHDLKVNADRVRLSLELTHGKPRVFYNECMSCATMMDNPYVYFAEWILPGNGSIVLLVTIEQHFGDRVDSAFAPMRKAETYKFFMHITASSLGLKSKYDVGRPVTEFLQLHPEYETSVLFVRFHTYNMKDTAARGNSGWKFIFFDGVLTYFEYNGWFGSNYGDNDVAAFDAAKKKATQLLADAKGANGKPGSVVSNVPKEYTVHLDYLEYRNQYIKAEWKSKNGPTSLEFEEYGGGKHVGTTFHIHYVFERSGKK
jgi:hypothetical protein